MRRNAPIAYQTQSVMTASPARLVAMLYDRAINALKEAVRAIAKGDIEGRWRANSKAIEILSHLAMTLDPERGGEVARNLERLYRFMLVRLSQVDLRNDPKPAEEVIALLDPLRQSWHELADRGAALPEDEVRQAGPAQPATADAPARLSVSA